MKKLILPLILLAAWVVHGRMVFAETRLMPWLTQHSAQIWSGDAKACEAYTDDVQVNVWAEDRGGHWEVEGGKGELCAYYRKAAAAFVVLDANTNTEFTDVSIQRKGFPWTEATLRYTAHVTVQAAQLPEIRVTSQDELTLVRGLGGVKIKAIESRSDQR